MLVKTGVFVVCAQYPLLVDIGSALGRLPPFSHGGPQLAYSVIEVDSFGIRADLETIGNESSTGPEEELVVQYLT